MLLGEGDATSVLNFPYIGLFCPHFLKHPFGIYLKTRAFMLCKHRPTKGLKQLWNKTSRI